MEQTDFIDKILLEEIKRCFPKFEDIKKGANQEEYVYCCIAFVAGFSRDFALRRIQYGNYPFWKDDKRIEDCLNKYNFSPDFLLWLIEIYEKMDYTEGVLLVERRLDKTREKNEERFLL